MGRTGFLTFALRAPKLTLLLVAAATAVLGWRAASVRFDGSLLGLVPNDDPERLYYADVAKTFGSEEVTLIGVFADDVFQPAVLEKIDELSREIADLDGVQQVVSLTTVQNAYSDDDGLHVGKLIREIPRATDDIETLRQKTLANPLYLRHVVAPDGKAAGITVVYRGTEEGAQARADLTRIRELVASRSGPASFTITPLPSLGTSGPSLAGLGGLEIAGLALLAIAIVLALGFRSLGGVVIPLAAALVATTWLLGIVSLAGVSVNLSTLLVPLLPFALTLTFAIHIVAGATPAMPGESSAAEAMLTRGTPVLAAALVGIAPLIPDALSHSSSLRIFGLLAMAGVATALLASASLVPVLLALWPAGGTARGGAWLAKLGHGARDNRRLIFFAAALLALLALLGLLRVQRTTPDLDASDTLVAERLAGTQPITIVLEGEGPSSVTKLRTLQALKDFQIFLGEQRAVDTVASLLDYLGVLRHALDAGELGSMPASQEEVDQLFLFANPDDLKPLVNGDRSRATILLRTKLGDSRAVNEFVDGVNRYAAEHLPRGVTAHATGSVVFVNGAIEGLGRAQLRGLWQSAIVLLVALSIVFLALRSGLAVFVAVALSPLLVFALLGWSRIDLSIWTAPVALVVSLLALAQTISVVAVFHRASHATRNADLAVAAAMLAGGRPLLLAGAALAAGLCLLGAIEWQPLRQIGAISAAAIAIGTLVSLVLDPALATAMQIITLWDLLRVDLGREPHRQLPLFAGLRAYQAKIVVLLARRERAARGSLLTRRGDVRDEIYVLLDGQADVYHGAGTPPRRRLGRGDVVGETGFAADRRCAADVVVSESADVVILDGPLLKRLERRYPRIAAVVMLNLARILSDRLESTTEALAGSRPHEE